VLADVYRAQNRLHEAEVILVAALELNMESDVLLRELTADLAAVRRHKTGANDGAKAPRIGKE
jgi:hypothetical protein